MPMVQNKNYRRLALAVILCVILFFGDNPRYLIAYTNLEDVFGDKVNVRITMDLQDASLRDVLKMLSVQSGLNFVASEAVSDRKITLYLDNVLLKDALDKIFKANNLTYELDEETNIFTVKDWGKPSIDLMTKVYFLKYSAVTNSKLGTANSGMKDALSKVISEYGKITEDPTTNSIIITDVPGKFEVIEQIINQLDVAVPQVLIEVEILDVDKSDVDKLGFKFNSGNWFTYTGPNLGGTYFPLVSDYFRKSTGKTAPTPASWTMTTFGFAIDFLSTRTTTKFLARPKLFVLNNETAELKLTTNEGLYTTSTTVTGTSTTSTTTLERGETGVTLKVTPQISMSTGEVTMVLEPAVKESVTGLTVGTQSTKDIEERSFKSTVRVKDGDTVIVGGLIRQKQPLIKTRVPFLSDVPVIGMLFRHKESGPRKEREILVFLTPRIIKNSSRMAEGQISSSQILSEREQEPAIMSKRNAIVSRVLGIYETREDR